MSLDSPPARRRFHRKESGFALLSRYGCMVVLGGFLLFTTMCSGLLGLSIFAGTPAEFTAATVLALATSVPYCLLLLWIDRNEKEPAWLIITALLWGAATATFISGIFNELFGMAAMSALGDAAIAGQVTASVSAPFIEELTKGFAVMMLFLLFRKDFDNVLDGVLYGALVGLGFAWFENIMYYVQAAEHGGIGQMVKLAWARGVVSGMGGSHAAYTGLTGLGFGLVRVIRRGFLRWTLVPLFWGLAMFAHFAWNTFVSLFIVSNSEAVTLLVSLPVATVVLQGPFLFLLMVVVAVVWRHENKVILSFLEDEADDIVTDDQRRVLVPARRRAWHGLRRFFSRGPLSWWRQRGLDADLIRLAFTKWHLQEDEETTWDPGDDADVQLLRTRILRRRAAMG